jgi:hypothetical protein
MVRPDGYQEDLSGMFLAIELPSVLLNPLQGEGCTVDPVWCECLHN